MQIRRLSRLAGGTCGRLTVVFLNGVLRRMHFAKPQRSRYRRRHRNGEGSQIVTTSIFLYTRPVYQNYNLQKATNTNRGIIGTLLNIEGNTKDSLKSRIDLTHLGIRKDLQVQDEGKPRDMALAVYVLDKVK